MFGSIDHDVLRFDVSVCDVQHGEVVETSEHLICVYFSYEGSQVFFLNGFVEIVRVVVHDDV